MTWADLKAGAADAVIDTFAESAFFTHYPSTQTFEGALTREVFEEDGVQTEVQVVSARSPDLPSPLRRNDKLTLGTTVYVIHAIDPRAGGLTRMHVEEQA